MSSVNDSRYWYNVFCNEIKKEKDQRDDTILKESIIVMNDKDIQRPNPQHYNRYAPIHYACQYERKDIMKLLLQRGANVNQATITYGETPLTLACQEGKLRIIKFLLSVNANLNQSNHSGWTPLLYAIENKHGNVVPLLLNLGAKVNQVTDRGTTPLLLACNNGLQDEDGTYVASLLIDKGAKMEHVDIRGWTPLHTASLEGRTGIVTLLIERGVNIKQRNPNSGWTALHIASRYGQLEIVKLLVKWGGGGGGCGGGTAMVDMIDKEGQTPLALAQQKHCTKVVKYLNKVQKTSTRQSMVMKFRTPTSKKNSEPSYYLQEPLPITTSQVDEVGTEEYEKDTAFANTHEHSFAKTYRHHQLTYDAAKRTRQDGIRESLIQPKQDASSDTPTFDYEHPGSNESLNDDMLAPAGEVNNASTDGNIPEQDVASKICLSTNDLKWINDIIDGTKRFKEESNPKSTKLWNVMNQYHVELQALARGKSVAWKDNQEVHALHQTPTLWEFYLHLHMLLRTSVLDCEVRSCGHVETKHASLLKYSRDVVRNGGVRKFVSNHHSVGQVVADVGQFAIRSGFAVACLPFGDLVSGLFGTVDERASMIAATNVATLATLASAIGGFNGINLLMELVARIITRARCSLGTCGDVKYGRRRNLMIEICGLAENTPVKQAAYHSAKAVIQMLMSPKSGSDLENILQNGKLSPKLTIHDLAVLVSAAVLRMDKKDVRKLPLITSQGMTNSVDSLIVNDGDPEKWNIDNSNSATKRDDSKITPCARSDMDSSYAISSEAVPTLRPAFVVDGNAVDNVNLPWTEAEEGKSLVHGSAFLATGSPPVTSSVPFVNVAADPTLSSTVHETPPRPFGDIGHEVVASLSSLSSFPHAVHPNAYSTDNRIVNRDKLHELQKPNECLLNSVTMNCVVKENHVNNNDRCDNSMPSSIPGGIQARTTLAAKVMSSKMSAMAATCIDTMTPRKIVHENPSKDNVATTTNRKKLGSSSPPPSPPLPPRRAPSLATPPPMLSSPEGISPHVATMDDTLKPGSTSSLPDAVQGSSLPDASPTTDVCGDQTGVASSPPSEPNLSCTYNLATSNAKLNDDKLHKLEEMVVGLQQDVATQRLIDKGSRKGGAKQTGPLMYADPLSEGTAQQRLHEAEVGIAAAHDGLAVQGMEVAVMKDTARSQEQVIEVLQSELDELRRVVRKGHERAEIGNAQACHRIGHQGMELAQAMDTIQLLQRDNLELRKRLDDVEMTRKKKIQR